MRTTLTLDDDIAAKVKQEMKETGDSFKETVNRLLRRGLLASQEPKEPVQFRVRARSMEPQPGVDFDNIGELLHGLDGPYTT